MICTETLQSFLEFCCRVDKFIKWKLYDLVKVIRTNDQIVLNLSYQVRSVCPTLGVLHVLRMTRTLPHVTCASKEVGEMYSFT